MATAGPISYSVPAGGALRAGLFDAGLAGGITLDDLAPAGLLSSNAAAVSGSILLDDLTPTGGGAAGLSWVPTSGRWAQVPVAATLFDVDPIKSAAHNPNHPLTPEWAVNTGRQAAVVYAWCGAAYDEASDTMWLGLGGGHQDYAGNEVYACMFNAPAPAWRMVRPPSGAVGNLLTTNDGQEASGVYSDGRPRATHTYNKWVYVPGVGAVLMAHGNASWTAGNGKRWAVFLGANGEASYTSEPTTYALNNTDGLSACYDPTRHAIWIVPGGTEEVHRYSIPGSGGAHTGAYTAVGTAAVRSLYTSVGYMPGADVLLIGTSNDAKTTSSWEVFDCATGTRHTPTFSGSGAIEAHTAGRCALRWVPSLGAFCTWNNSTNTTQITRLTPGANPRTNTWVIDTLPVDGGNTVTPDARTALGTYGRFAYSPGLGGFLVFNATSGPTYFYKI